jgi:hypothetical protein
MEASARNTNQGHETIEGYLINDHWGVLSTPVVDRGTLYGCAWISPDGTPKAGVHYAFAIDVATGNDVHLLWARLKNFSRRASNAAHSLRIFARR